MFYENKAAQRDIKLAKWFKKKKVFVSFFKKINDNLYKINNFSFCIFIFGNKLKLK